MTDGTVQVPPDSSGKKIDTAELTRPDTTVVERQRVVIADNTDPSVVADQARQNIVDRYNRQVAEQTVAAQFEEATNVGNLRRSGERPFAFDRRGGALRGVMR
jgi:hypothetical protein